MVSGTQGYAENAGVLIEKYEALAFTHKHEAVMHVLPTAPVAALDIGAGTGADARWLSAQGHRVVAVEPTTAFREFGLAKQDSSLITWVDDSLPSLSVVTASHQQFGLILLTAVWMHLDEQERSTAMPALASLLAPGGVVVMA